ncbi:MAG: metallophosphoesterase family protein [Candidatus Aenigmatarchaeota archaeon]
MEEIDEGLGELKGEVKISAVVASDPHAWKRNLDDIEEEVTKLSNYADEYDCDELWIAGDICSLDYAQLVADSEFEKKKIVPGNHDTLDRNTLEKNGLLGEDVECNDRLEWEEEVGSEKQKFSISHKPHDFDTRINWSRVMDYWHQQKDVIVHGHSHMSRYRATDENILVIGCGSTFRNFYEPLNPRRSCQILKVNSHVKVSEIDMEKDEKVLEKKFGRTDDGFEEMESIGKDYQEKVYPKSYPKEMHFKDHRNKMYQRDFQKELYRQGVNDPNF